MTKTIPHGTISGYQYHRCRCDECRAAAAARQRKWRAAQPPITGDEEWHGSVSGYKNHRCRCSECRAAHTAYYREYMPKWRAAQPPITGDEEWHGSVNGYKNHRCRCSECRAAGLAPGQARGRALTRLKALHPDEFDQLMAEELDR